MTNPKLPVMTTLSQNAVMIELDEDVYLFSYDTFIIRVRKGSKEILNVSSKWDYSQTTSKHLNMFFRELGMDLHANRTREQKRIAWLELGLID